MVFSRVLKETSSGKWEMEEELSMLLKIETDKLCKKELKKLNLEKFWHANKKKTRKQIKQDR